MQQNLHRHPYCFRTSVGCESVSAASEQISLHAIQFNMATKASALPCTACMLSPSVTGHGLHRLGLESIEVKLKSTWPKCTWVGVPRCDPSQTLIKSIEAKLKTSTWPRRTWSEVAQGGRQVPRGQVHQSQVQVQRGTAKSKSNEAQPSWTWTWQPDR